MGKLKHHLQVKHSDNWGRRNSSLLYESVWSSPAQREDCMVWREKVWIWAWLPLICCAILGKFLNISGPQFLDLHDGLIKSQDFYIYIEKSRWKDVVNCKAPWKCSFIFIIRIPILLPCFLKREWMREKWKFATYIISPVLFLKYFLLMSFDSESITVPSKIHRHFSERLGIPWFSSVQLLSHVRLFATPWTAACQASLSITNSQSSPKLMSIESVMPSNTTLSTHVVPFSSCPQSLPALGSFQMSQFFASGGQSIGVSASASVLPVNTLVAQLVRNPPAMWETWVWSLGWEHPLENSYLLQYSGLENSMKCIVHGVMKN